MQTKKNVSSRNNAFNFDFCRLSNKPLKTGACKRKNYILKKNSSHFKLTNNKV